MRYIKFRSLRHNGNKKIELVRVSDNGKIISKGYGPLELQVLDGDVKDQGVNITPSRILCFGATNTVDDISITGTVDVYIDGVDEPVLSNVTEAQLLNYTEADFQGLLKPYIPKPTQPTETFHFLMQGLPKVVPDYQGDFRATVVYGVKRVDTDIQWITTHIQTDDDWGSNQFMTYSGGPASVADYIMNSVDMRLGLIVECTPTISEFIKPDDIYTKLKHGEYFRKLYSPYITATDDKPYRSWNNAVSIPLVVDLKFTAMDETIEYIVFPSVAMPYGNDVDKFHINTTMMYDNIVHYQDGTIVTNDQTVPTLPTDNLYQQGTIPLVDISGVVNGVESTFDITHIQPTFDQLTLISGKYFDVIFPRNDFERALFSYDTADTEQYQTQGISWVDMKLGGREGQSLTMAREYMEAFVSDDVGFVTVSPAKTSFHNYYIEANVRYRVKLPADVTEFTLNFL